MDKWFVILGGNMLLRGVCEKLQSYGYKVLVVDWNAQPAVTGDLHLQVDVKDSAAVIETLKAMNVPFDGSFTSIDLAVPTCNAIHHWLGLAEMPAIYNKVLTKADMREAWQRDGLFGRVSISGEKLTTEEICRMGSKMKLIIKPNVAASSRGITVLERKEDGLDPDDVTRACEHARKHSFDGVCLVEEYVEGREFTVDMLGDDSGFVSVYGVSVKYHTANSLHNRVATKLHWNSEAYSDAIYDAIAEYGKRCYRSIGLKNSFGHLEIIMYPKNPTLRQLPFDELTTERNGNPDDFCFSPVEIGARSSGYIASHTVTASSGKDYLHDYIDMLHGRPIEHADHIHSEISSMWFGYDMPLESDSVCPSTLQEFLDPRICVMASKRDGLTVPRHFGNMTDDNSRDNYGYEMLSGDRNILTIESITAAERLFLARYLAH